jgi:putative addiction module component (TIGR02574 family)
MTIVKDTTLGEILEKAMKLPWEQRCQLIDELKATLPPPPPDGMTREEFRAELDRRWEEYKTGKVQMVAWEEVKAKARQQLNEHG